MCLYYRASDLDRREPLRLPLAVLLVSHRRHESNRERLRSLGASQRWGAVGLVVIEGAAEVIGRPYP
jgi:hypothetical protein